MTNATNKPNITVMLQRRHCREEKKIKQKFMKQMSPDMKLIMPPPLIGGGIKNDDAV